MRSWKVLCVGLMLPLSALHANSDTLTVSEKTEIKMVHDAVLFLDSLNQVRNQALAHFFYSNKTVSAAVDTSFLVSDEELAARLDVLNKNTPLELLYNKRIRSFIHLYAVRQKELTERMLGLSKYYFPIIEPALDKYDIPLEIKHLAIVESALNPAIRSRAGATGLWQFMYWTGKANGLTINSYVDERNDPVKSTEAACQYLLELHGMYHDWNLALAAYNSGPGNVNKAIRRSGGKRDYWSIWPYLPRETRSYVPAFIAVNYIMNYAPEHGIVAVEPMLHFWEGDTIVVQGPLEFDVISTHLNIEMDLLVALNPSFKKNRIPDDGKNYAIVLPADKIMTFIDRRDSIMYAEPIEMVVEEEEKEEQLFHYVRNGEVLGLIAGKYHCSVRQIMEWNNLRNTQIKAGQRLIVYGKKSPNTPTLVKQTVVETKTTNQKASTESETHNYIYHTVKSGDTLWDIAKKYDGVSVSEIKQLNGSVNVHRLKLGQKLKIKVAG